MPRKAPDGKGVIEHRITLGNYERTQLDELANAKKTQLYLQPFQSVLPVALAGGAGYLGLAYVMEWWPFEGPSYAFGFAFADKYFIGGFDDISGEKGDIYIEEEMKKFDAMHASNVKYLNENPTMPATFYGSAYWKSRQAMVTNYSTMRAKRLAQFARIQEDAANRAARAKEKSDAY
jgi:hypothetical protein